MPKLDTSIYKEEVIKECQSYVIGESCESCTCYDFECLSLLEGVRLNMHKAEECPTCGTNLYGLTTNCPKCGLKNK